MGWYKRLPPHRSKAARTADAKRTQRSGERNRKPLATRDPSNVFYRTFSRSIYTDGYRTKVCTRGHIAKFFEVDISTVVSWSKLGVLPTPVMYMEKGDSRYPIYLAAQIRCLIIVINDLVKDGYISIPWSYLTGHIEMLHAGYDQSFRNYKKRYDTGIELDEKPDRHGVVFLD